MRTENNSLFQYFLARLKQYSTLIFLDGTITGTDDDDDDDDDICIVVT